YPYAAGNYDGYLPIHAEPGENENNRIVNPQQYDFSVSRIKKGVSLDRFLDEINCDSDLFIKMDTQGAEPEVFEGLENTNKARKIAGILE
ncbi:MAG: hypothetical protein GTO02_18585, partial [Candidatus Dadabacteria bacterium]|nr:hypothetical protein [Candidatus Dadabacteria bacterium]